MAGIGKYKLSDASARTPKGAGRQGGQLESTHDTAAEQVRQAQVNHQARNAKTSDRERMVDIGRGGQQAGRQGS